MKFAYADPPYIGQAKKHYGRHPDFAGEVDHEELILRLETDFDGWALSLSVKSLQTILGLCPDGVRVLAWVKPMAPPLGDHYRYNWEPVIMRPLRRPGSEYVPMAITATVPGSMFQQVSREHVIGEKPEAFARWIFAAAGLDREDEFHDLFPGSGAVTKAWEGFCRQGVLL